MWDLSVQSLRLQPITAIPITAIPMTAVPMTAIAHLSTAKRVTRPAGIPATRPCYETCYQTCPEFCDALQEFGISSNPSGIFVLAGGTRPAQQISSHTFPAGMIVTLSSEATTLFSGDCDGTGTCTITMDDHKNVTGTH